MQWRLPAFAALLVLTSVACGSSEHTEPPAQVLDPAQSSVTVDRIDGVIADNLDKAQITVKLVDTTGKAFSGASVIVQSTGASNTLFDPELTDAEGTTRATLSTTKAETKTISVIVQTSAGDVTLPQQAFVNFVHGPAGQLTFRSPPTSTKAGRVMKPVVQVALLDEHGNLVRTGSTEVTLKVAGADNSLLQGTTSQMTLEGVASFVDLHIDVAATGYALTAISGSLSVTSATFNISP